MYSDSSAKRDVYNSTLRPAGASEFDDSYAGYGGDVNNPEGNRGFNKEFYPDGWQKRTSEKNNTSSKFGYGSMIENDWKALKKEAQKAAEDCACGCKTISLKFVVKDSVALDKKTNGLFTIPDNETLPCQKNAKP